MTSTTKVEQAKRRIASGFYDRREVLAETCKRLTADVRRMNEARERREREAFEQDGERWDGLS